MVQHNKGYSNAFRLLNTLAKVALTFSLDGKAVALKDYIVCSAKTRELVAKLNLLGEPSCLLGLCQITLL